MSTSKSKLSAHKILFQHIPFIFAECVVRKDYIETICLDSDGYYYIAIRIKEGKVDKMLTFEESAKKTLRELEEIHKINLRLEHRIYLN
jgi:hypothetical protein